MSQKIRVTQIRSAIAQPKKTVAVLQALGLRKIGAQRVHEDNNCTRGMINKISHLVRYEIMPQIEEKGDL